MYAGRAHGQQLLIDAELDCTVGGIQVDTGHVSLPKSLFPLEKMVARLLALQGRPRAYRQIGWRTGWKRMGGSPAHKESLHVIPLSRQQLTIGSFGSES